MGFAFAGHFLFGEESHKFERIGLSFLQIFLFIFAGPNPDDETRNEPVTRAIFFILTIVRI